MRNLSEESPAENRQGKPAKNRQWKKNRQDKPAKNRQGKTAKNRQEESPARDYSESGSGKAASKDCLESASAKTAARDYFKSASGNTAARDFVEKAAAILLALLIWQIAAVALNQKILLVTPLAVIKRVFTLWREEDFFSVLFFTFSRIGAGYLIASLSGILSAFISCRLHFVENLLWPWVLAFRSVPVASMAVILLIWVSPENIQIVLAFLVVYPIVYGHILEGLKSLDIKLKEMAFVFDVRPAKRLRYIVLPQLKPYIFSALSVTVGMAWKAGIAAEILGTPAGSVGKMIYQSKIWLDTDDLLAWTLILVIISALLEKILLAALKKILAPRDTLFSQTGKVDLVY